MWYQLYCDSKWRARKCCGQDCTKQRNEDMCMEESLVCVGWDLSNDALSPSSIVLVQKRWVYELFVIHDRILLDFVED